MYNLLKNMIRKKVVWKVYVSLQIQASRRIEFLVWKIVHSQVLNTLNLNGNLNEES